MGCWKKPFVVHADVVSPHSRVLHQLIEGPFKEGIERYAELPEIDPETFQYFLAYAYFTLDLKSDNETTTKTPSMQRTSISRLIELLLVKEHKKFRCKSCEETPELRFSLSFPQCDECNQDELRGLKWAAHCIVFGCSANGEYILGLFCRQCLQDLRILSWGGFAEHGLPKLQLNLPRHLDELQDFHFNIPIRMKDISGVMEHVVPFPQLATASLVDTARLAVFADVYEVKPLFESALLSLYRKLTQQSLDKESITTICELTENVYNGTPDRPTQTSLRDANILRRILSQFLATHRDMFTSSETFMQLVCQKGELAGDILLALSVVG